MGCCQNRQSKRKFRTITKTDFRSVNANNQAKKQPDKKDHDRIYIRFEQITSSEVLFSEMRKIIFRNQNQYGLLSLHVFQKIFDTYDKLFYPTAQLNALITYILEFMIECYNRSLPKMQKRCKKDFFYEFGEKMGRVLKQTVQINKKALCVMSYLGESTDDYGCYLNLKFNLNIQEVMSVAEKTRDLCHYDDRAFFFLTNYLYNSCTNLQKYGKDIETIEQVIKDILQKIISKFPPPPELLDSEQTKFQTNFRIQEEQVTYNQINLFQMQDVEKKSEFIYFVLQHVRQAEKDYNKLVSLIKDICLQKGNNFKIKMKVKNQNDRRALERVMEQLLTEQQEYIMFQISDYYRATQNQINVEEYINEEERWYQQQMADIYNRIDRPIKFKIEDIIKVKCIFKKVQDINQCADKLKKRINLYEQCQLVQVINKLRGDPDTSQIIFKIMVGKTIAELHLYLEAFYTHNSFMTNVRNLLYSKFFSPLSMIKVMQEEIKNDYFKQMGFYFVKNNISTHQKQRELYNVPETFKSLILRYQSFLNLIHYQAIHEEELQSGVLKGLKSELSFLVKQNQSFSQNSGETAKVFKNNGQLYSNQGEHDLAFIQFQKYLHRLEAQIPRLPQTQEQMAETYMKMGKEKEKLKDLHSAMNYYQKNMNLVQSMSKAPNQKIATAYMSVGEIYQALINYQKALYYFDKCLEIRQKLKGKDSVQYLQTLKKIGFLYEEQQKYDKALLYFNRCLKIQQIMEDKEEIDCVETISKIGLINYLQGNYDQALRNYGRALQIQEKVKGRGSMVSSYTLYSIGLTYGKQEKYNKALQFYGKSLDITERVKGKQSIECAKILYHSGLVQSQQGKCKSALQKFNRCLDIQEKELGVGAIQCAQTLNNLGKVYSKQGNNRKALEAYRKCLEIQEKVNGSQSMQCAIAYQNIGDVYKQQENNEQALQFFEKCLDIKERIKGKGSLQCTFILNKIGLVYVQQQNHDLALDYFIQCMQIQENIQGKDSIQCALTLNSIATVYDNQGKHKKALQYYGRCLNIYEQQQRLKGKPNINSVKLFRDIGNIYQKEDNMQKANYFFNKSQKLKLQFKK